MQKFKKTRYRGKSIVDGLKRSVYGRRWKWPSNYRLTVDVGTLEEIAKANGMDYTDKFGDRVRMLELLKAGELIRPEKRN